MLHGVINVERSHKVLLVPPHCISVLCVGPLGKTHHQKIVVVFGYVQFLYVDRVLAVIANKDNCCVLRVAALLKGV